MKRKQQVIRNPHTWYCKRKITPSRGSVRKLQDGKSITEYDVQQEILGQFDAMDLVTDHPPIVAVNAKSSDPHYAPSATDTPKRFEQTISF